MAAASAERYGLPSGSGAWVHTMQLLSLSGCTGDDAAGPLYSVQSGSRTESGAIQTRKSQTANTVEKEVKMKRVLVVSLVVVVVGGWSPWLPQPRTRAR